MRAAVKHLKACCPDLLRGGTSSAKGSGIDLRADWTLLERQEELLATHRSKSQGTASSTSSKEGSISGGGVEPDLLEAESRIRDEAEAILQDALKLESQLREEAIHLAFRWESISCK